MNYKRRLKVSVIMPVFNGEKYLTEAIDSILNQTFDEFEFIVINDGSEDNTSKIIRSYQDDRIRFIERENKGFAYSLNQGIQMSTGKYIARMDGDDIAYNNRLELQYEFMESHPAVDILGGQAEIIDAKGKIIDEIRCPVSWGNIQKCLKYLCPVYHPTYFVRKKAYDLTQGYRPLPPVEDYDFLLRALEKGCVIENLPDKVLKYRKLSSGMSAENIQRTIYLTAMIQKMHNLRVTSHNRDDKMLATLQKYNRTCSDWFRFVYYLRENLISRMRKHKKPLKYLFASLIILVSLMHYQIALNSYKAFRAAPYRR